MKKTAFILALAITMCAFSSCGDKKNNDEDTEASVSDAEENSEGENSIEEETTEAPVDYSADIIGIWMSDEDKTISLNSESEGIEDDEADDEGDYGSFASGMAFYTDNTGDFMIDFSNIMYFKDDKSFVAGETEFPPECTVEDDEILAVTTGENDILVLYKVDSFGSENNIDGTYVLAGGALYDSINESLQESYGDTESLFYFIITGEKFYLDINKAFTYQLNGDMLALSGDEAFFKNGADTVRLNIEGNKLSLIDNDGTETFSRFVLQ